MSNPIDALDDYLSNIETRHIEVTLRAGAKPLRVYYTPMTSGEMSTIQRKHSDFPSANIEALIDLIILKALKEDGEKAYTIEHKPKLKRIPHEVIYKISAPMMSAGSIEEAEGN
jgi:hypothetical protein